MNDTFNIINPPSGDIVYRYDDTFEGLMTAVFESYSLKPAPVSIVGQQHQQVLGHQYLIIKTDNKKAERVVRGIQNKMGDKSYESVWTCSLSDNPDKADIIYKYIRLGMRLGQAVNFYIADERVAALNKLVSLVKRESSRFIEFVRFSKTAVGVYYAKISPENHVLPIMMPFFAGRFNSMPFLIHDTTHQIAGVYDTKEWFICPAEHLTPPDCSADEIKFQTLWKRFYDTIAIRERINYNLRRQLMPKKYWKNITEMTVSDNTKPTLLPSELSRIGNDAKALEN